MPVSSGKHADKQRYTKCTNKVFILNFMCYSSACEFTFRRGMVCHYKMYPVQNAEYNQLFRLSAGNNDKQRRTET